MAAPMLTYNEQVKVVAEMTGVAQVDVKYLLDAYGDLVVNQIAKGNRFRVLGLIQVEAKKRPAQKPREGRNPRTGEAVMIGPKPASVAIKARVLTKLQSVKPSVKKLDKVLA